MQNDKNFIFFIVITVVILFAYPKIIQLVAPQLLPVQPQLVREIVPEQSPASLHAPAESNWQPGAAGIAEQEITSSEEQSFDIENERYRMTVRLPYGDITRVVLKEYRDPKTGQGTTLIDVPPQHPGILRDAWFSGNLKVESSQAMTDRVIINYADAQGLRVKKIIKLDEKAYKFSASYEFFNGSDNTQVIDFKSVVVSGWTFGEDMDKRTTERVTFLSDLKRLHKKPFGANAETVTGVVAFAGLKGRYFSLLMSAASGGRAVSTQRDILSGIESVSMEMDLAELTIAAGNSTTQEIVMYAGPNSAEKMNAVGRDFQEVLGRGFGAAVSEIVLLILRSFYKVCGNYGFALILVSLLINTLLAPLSVKSYQSMKSMQQLQPFVEKLRTEHKDNPQQLNKELMELYRKKQINPASGCLPLLLQIPVFWALFNVLQQVVELRGASFLWIKDLSGADSLLSIEGLKNIPLIGGFTQGNINVLPVLMVVIQALQQKMTQPAAGQSTEQQKMMAVMMPLMMGLLFYNFPSGLMLYFLTNSIFSFALQWKISREK